MFETVAIPHRRAGTPARLCTVASITCYVHVFAPKMRVTSKAPCRVDLAGATLDIWPLYLFHDQSVTVNFAVDRYTSCEATLRDDSAIVLRSRDQATEEKFESFAHLKAAKRYKLPLLALLVRFFGPELALTERGLTLESNSEAPAGAGISGSSSLMITVASALNKLTGSRYKIEKLREIAQNIEAQVIRVPTGAQDYYPAMYGGVSAIDLTAAGISRTPLPIQASELNQRFVLAYTGAPRNSGINNWEVMKAHIDADKAVHANFDRIASVANRMRNALLHNDWVAAGSLMREDWANRRRNIPTISTPLIDELIACTRRAGSTGAKVCGAGGGGCVVFLVEPRSKEKIARLVEEKGAQVLDVKVAPRGVQVG
jgi:D-glycero-alpha-D-manno-heptose-7-phosphate kinase